MISQKNLNILTYLIDMSSTRQYAPVEELAKRFDVSSRAIRYDLEKIDYYLKRKGFAKLGRDRKNGVFLDASPEKIEGVRRELLAISADAYALSREERVLYLKLILFETKGYATYDDLSAELSVSRKTVIEDVHLIRKGCERRSVRIAATKYGIRLEAPEHALRSMVVDSLLEQFAPVELWQIVRDVFPNKSIILEKKWRAIAGLDGIAEWEERLRRAEQEENASLSDAHYYLTILLTALVLKRNQGGKPVEHGEKTSPDARTQPILRRYFDAAKKEAKGTAKGGLPEAEERFILAELDRIFRLPAIDRAENMSSAILESFLFEVGKRLGKKYSADVELRISLQKHFLSLIENDYVCYDAGGISIKGIVRENPELYACIRDCLSALEPLRGNPSLELESSLVMLHFLAADERQDVESADRRGVLIACRSGVGTAKIVSVRLEKRFPRLRIIATTAVRNVETQVRRERPDLIVSTVPLECPGIPVIQVNTLMTEDDLERIRIALQGSARDNAVPRRDPYTRAMEAILHFCDVRDEKLLAENLSNFFRRERENQAADLLDLLTEDCVSVGLEAADWEAAIRGSAEPLVSRCVEPQYVDAMVENIRTMGPYIVLTKGIALPHSLSTDGVLRAGVSLATLREPVKFGHKYNDPVRLVICIATTDKKEHMREMSKLTTLISSRGFVKKICNAGSVEAVLGIVREMSGGTGGGGQA